MHRNESEITLFKLQLKLISLIESELDHLLTLSECEMKGFCSFYPKICLEQLSVMKSVISMELNNPKKSAK